VATGTDTLSVDLIDGGATDALGTPDSAAPGPILRPGVGFETSSTRWSVPPSGLADGFFASAYADGARGWLVSDLDGDGIPDLVQTADAQNAAGYVWRDLEGPHWRVFRGTRAGFATTAERWAVPESGLPDGFFAAYYASDARQWALVDLDADGRPELVQTADSARAGGQVWTDARGAHWKVWRSGAAGFAGAGERFAVPESGLSDGFFAAYYGFDMRHWTLVDLDSDGRLDLVQTADPVEGGGFVFRDANGPFWKVWRGGAEGFAAESRRVAVPESGLPDGFFAATYAGAPPDTRFWTFADIDGDGRPDLVHTADPEGAGGVVWSDATGAFWRVYFGTSSGFGRASRVAIPASGLADGFFATAYFAAPQLGGERFWMMIDLDGDRQPELVQSADPSKRGGFVHEDGEGPYWKVWRIAREGAMSQPVRWSVPASGLEDGFFAPFWSDSGNGSRAWFIRDMDGDGRVDLVQTADAARSGLYVWADAAGAYWKVFRGR
jgi:hypothetical protein